MKKILSILFLFVLFWEFSSPFKVIAAQPVVPTPNLALLFMAQAPPADSCGEIGQTCCRGNGAIPKIPNTTVQIPVVKDLFQGFIDFFNNNIVDSAMSSQSDAGKVISVLTAAAGGSGSGSWCKNGWPSDGRLNLQTTCTCLDLGAMATLSTKCKLIKTPTEQDECSKCVDPANPKGYWTAIGCVSLSFEEFIGNVIFKFGLGLAGVTAFGCIIYSAISLQLSQGSPEKIKKSQEMLTSCILGLILIIFSVFILRTIGVTVLQIPGLK